MRRKDHRLKNYDYSTANFYFITINTKNRKHIFGSIKNNEMLYNENGNLVNEILPNIFDNGKVEIICYQIMPNHLHMIVKINKDGIIKLENAISYLKSTISRKVICEKPLWDRGYYDRVIRDDQEYKNVYNYIINNPYREKYQW